jgi:hypothetical protein
MKKIVFCVLVGIRTPNLLIRSQMLYPIELQKQLIISYYAAKVVLFFVKSNYFATFLKF